MYFSVLCCLIAAVGAVSGNLQPICQPSNSSNSSGPKLPTFPTAFSTFVELNVVNKNYTVVFKEFYDQKADKGRVDVTENGNTRIGIFDYTLDEILHVNMNAKNCTVSSASDKTDMHKNLGKFFHFFGFGPHIESVTQLFKFGKEFNETYMGVSSVRGIRCHHWRACISTNVSSYNMDYYFSVPGWGTSWKMLNSTVIRAVANGTSLNFHQKNATVDLNTTHNFHCVYDFFNFRASPPDPSSFQLPEGLYCEGLKGANKTVPKVPPVFSVEYESIMNIRNHSVSYWQEIYDLEKKLSLLKMPNYQNPSAGPMILIHDFNTGVGYNISGGHPGAVCKPFNLTLGEWDSSDDGNHRIRMKTTQEIFNTPHTNGSSALVYKGTGSVRGISADIWVGKGVTKHRRGNGTIDVKFVLEWYFAKPNWRFSENWSFRNIQHQVPLRVDYYLPTGRHIEINMFNFDAEAAAQTHFDIKPCFTWEQQRLVRFSLAGNYDKYGDSKQFILDITKAISAVANVSIIRVNGIRVLDGRRNKEEEISVMFILLDRTKSMGSDVEVVYSEKGLVDALAALKNSVQSGKFKVQVTQNKTLNAYKDSFVVGFAPRPLPTVAPSSQPQPGGGSEHRKGLSTGAAVGVSIVMLVVGIAGGLIIAHVIMKRHGTSLFQYQRQE